MKRKPWEPERWGCGALWEPGARRGRGEGGGEHTKESKYKVTHGKGKRTFCKVGLGLPYGKGT